MKINNKEDIINYFKSGYKDKQLIGVENEKFLFEKNPILELIMIK